MQWSWAVPLWLFTLCQFCSITKLCALDSGFKQRLPPGLRLQDVVEPDAVLIEMALQTASHCFSCVFICGEAQSVPAEKRAPERFSASDGKGTSSYPTAPFRSGSHETLLPFVLASSAASVLPPPGPRLR